LRLVRELQEHGLRGENGPNRDGRARRVLWIDDLRAASDALRRGGLRWLSISDDALTFLREAPGESVLVHAVRAEHPLIRIPATVVGTELTGLAGSSDLRADADGMLILPSQGPAFHMWRLVEV
jgi:alpha-glucosidase